MNRKLSHHIALCTFVTIAFLMSDNHTAASPEIPGESSGQVESEPMTDHSGVDQLIDRMIFSVDREGALEDDGGENIGKKNQCTIQSEPLYELAEKIEEYLQEVAKVVGSDGQMTVTDKLLMFKVHRLLMKYNRVLAPKTAKQCRDEFEDYFIPRLRELLEEIEANQDQNQEKLHIEAMIEAYFRNNK